MNNTREKDQDQEGLPEAIDATAESGATRRLPWAVIMGALWIITLTLLVLFGLKIRTMNKENFRASVQSQHQAEEMLFLLSLLGDSSGEAAEEGAALQVFKILDDALSKVERRYAGKPLDLSRYLDLLGRANLHANRLDLAEQLLQRALKMRTALSGAESLEVARSHLHVARLMRRKETFDDALRHLDDAKRIFMVTLGKDNPSIITVYDELARTYEAMGDAANAGSALAEYLKSTQTYYGDEALQTAQANLRVALFFSKAQRPQYASQLISEALAIIQKKYGPEHPRVAELLIVLADQQSRVGRVDTAESLYRQAQTIWQDALGNESPQVARTISELAFLYWRSWRLEEAQVMYEQALALNRKLDGETSDVVAWNMHNLAQVESDRGNLDAALKLRHQVLSIWEKRYGAEHPLVALEKYFLGEANLLAGNLDDAALNLEQALTIWTRDPDHPHEYAGLGHRTLGMVMLRQGQLDRAESLFQKACKDVLDQPDADLNERNSCFSAMARLAMARDDEALAAELLNQATQETETRLGPTDIHLGALLALQGRIALRSGDPDGAVTCFERSITILEGSAARLQPQLVSDFEVYPTWLESQNRVEEAKQFRTRMQALLP